MILRCNVVFLFMLSILSTQAQLPFVFNFEPLQVVDTVTSKSTLDSLQYNAVQSISADMFTVNQFNQFHGFYLVKKEGAFWNVYELNGDGRNESIQVQCDGQYIHYYTNYTSASRGLIVDYGYFNLINVETLQSIDLPWFEVVESYDSDVENAQAEIIRCHSQFVIQDKELLVMTLDDGLGDCLSSGVYAIEGDSLKKVKHYDEYQCKMKEVVWAGSFSTFMTLEQVESLSPYYTIEPTIDKYSSCAGDEHEAYVIKNGDDSLVTVLLNNMSGWVEEIIVFDAISFGPISTAMTAEELFALFPIESLHIDLLSELEYLTINEYNIKVIFNTTDSNRVGEYKDDQCTGLLNPKTKISYISLQ